MSKWLAAYVQGEYTKGSEEKKVNKKKKKHKNQILKSRGSHWHRKMSQICKWRMKQDPRKESPKWFYFDLYQILLLALKYSAIPL